MNYYERHLGDYTRDTAHLSLLEHGVYTILLDRYYVTERGIPDDKKYRLARAHSKAERNAVNVVLEEFFYLDDGIWKNQRAEEEIADYQNRARANRENGAKGGRPKMFDNPEETRTKPTENPTITQIKPNNNPDKTHTKPTKNPSQSPVTSIKETPSLSFGGKESATEKPNGNPVHNPTENPDAFVAKPSDISSVLRRYGIQGNPQNPKVMALADHRIRISTISAACQLARDRKPNERIPANYVIAILEGWVREAENAGETEIKPKETRDAENQRILDELTGRTRRENDARTIDSQARFVG